MKKCNLAIVGATGLVGGTFLKVLEEKENINIDKIYFYASKKSAGKIIVFRDKDYKVIELTEKNIKNKKIDFALFSAGGSTSKAFAPVFVKFGATVIDNSSAFRMEKEVPLIVPQVNAEDAYVNKGIISNPNCSTIQCMLPLKALDNEFKLKKVNYVTFQAVSGSGIKGIIDLEKTTKKEAPEFYPYPIFNNCLPHIGSFLENGYTEEEIKMINETKKILKNPSLKITATCVRVPIIHSHSVDISAEFEKEVDLEKAKNLLAGFNGIKLIDDIKNNVYPIATMAIGKDEVLVGRVRKDLDNPNLLHMFCVADNIRKGAASNAVEILELFLN